MAGIDHTLEACDHEIGRGGKVDASGEDEGEVAWIEVQTLQKRSYLEHKSDRVLAVVGNVRNQLTHSHWMGMESCSSHQYTSELGTQRQVQGSSCEVSGNELRETLPSQ
jgi:hypothetical protein